MRLVNFTNIHRKKHFDFFNSMSNPHFNICAKVRISNLLEFIDKNNLNFTYTMVYFISKTANSIPEFRYRIRNKKIFEYDVVHPSFTVNTEKSEVFSFCETKYTPDYQLFTKNAQHNVELMQTNPSFEDEPGRDDYLFLSAIPWIHFTGLNHAMNYNPTDSIPRITWGKYIEENNIYWMPLSIQAHHAIVNGRQMGVFYEKFQYFLDNPADSIK